MIFFELITFIFHRCSQEVNWTSTVMPSSHSLLGGSIRRFPKIIQNSRGSYRCVVSALQSQYNKHDLYYGTQQRKYLIQKFGTYPFAERFKNTKGLFNYFYFHWNRLQFSRNVASGALNEKLVVNIIVIIYAQVSMLFDTLIIINLNELLLYLMK